MKNRKIYGIDFNITGDYTTNPIINYGEGKYASVTWEHFLKSIETVKIPTRGPRGGEIFKSLKDSVELFKTTSDLKIDFLSGEFINLYFNNTYVEINNQVIVFEKGSYLIERNEFVRFQDGEVTEVKIQNYKGYEIHYDANISYGFSLTKENFVKDEFWSIEDTKKEIDKIVNSRTNQKTAETADGWLVLDLVSQSGKYELTLEYHDGDEIELDVLDNYSDALDSFLDYYSKNK